MGSIAYAKNRARTKSRQVYRTNKYKPKRAILKKFSNFVGKATYETVKSSRPKRRYTRPKRRYTTRYKRRRY